jgi:hypothetical protein
MWRSRPWRVQIQITAIQIGGTPFDELGTVMMNYADITGASCGATEQRRGDRDVILDTWRRWQGHRLVDVPAQQQPGVQEVHTRDALLVHSCV